MKNITITFLLILTALQSMSQVMGYKKTDLKTANIEGYEVNVGDTLRLGFGSGANGEFIFIAILGKGMIASTSSSAGMSNQAIVVEYLSKPKSKRIYGVPEIVAFCKPTFGKKGGVKFWFVPQLKNAILKDEILWPNDNDQ